MIEGPTGEEIDRLKEELELTWTQIDERFPGIKRETLRSRHRAWKKKSSSVPVPEQSEEFCGVPARDVIRALKRKPRTLHELSEVVDRAESTVEDIIAEMVAAGYAIERDEQRRVLLPDKPAGDYEPSLALFPEGGQTFEICFGVVSDTHGGSRAEQVTALRDFVHIAREEYGVRHILHGGDTFAGYGVYRGQAADLYAITGEEQADAVANNLPEYDDLTWYLLGGNHDYAFFKSAGLDVRRELVSLGRDDVVLLDYDAADVPLLPGVEARLWHPSGGVPYALSYRGQKGAAQLAQDELMSVVMGEKPKPTIRLMLIGHLHVMYMFDHGPMTVIGMGCFEGQTNYLRRKGLVPHVGGWILRCQFVDGMLHRLDPVRIRYREIEDDWKPWWARRQAKREEVEELEPIFSLAEEGGG